eukprot:jgi/Mesvir1/184/Mv13536-RA.1
MLSVASASSTIPHQLSTLPCSSCAKSRGLSSAASCIPASARPVATKATPIVVAGRESYAMGRGRQVTPKGLGLLPGEKGSTAARLAAKLEQRKAAAGATPGGASGGAGAPDPVAAARMAEISAAYAEAMKDPRVQASMATELDPVAAQLKGMEEVVKDDPVMKKRLEEIKASLKDPETRRRMEAQIAQSQMVAAQMGSMQERMKSPEMQERLKALEEDPELKDVVADMRANGPQALQKYWNDPVVLKKMAAKMGNVMPPPAGAAAAAAMARPPGVKPPEVKVNSLHDAAKYNDTEAAEDFIAIGKDVNEKDAEGRTCLHYSGAFGSVAVAKLVLATGKVDFAAVDPKGNTALHYAAGYGRAEIVELLLDAGADVSIKNGSGKTAAELVKLDSRNPVAAQTDIVARLEGAAAGGKKPMFTDQ